MPENNFSFEEYKELAKKFVNGTFQTLIQWMPVGGSSWAFISFIREEEWIIAIVTFPVVLVTAVWASYTQSFVQRLREIYEEKGRKDVDFLMGLNTRFDQAIKWHFAKPEKKYLICQGNACNFYTTEGATNIFKPLLKDV